MANRYKAFYCRRLVNNYISEIERKKTSIQKNFEDMDFSNSNLRDEYEELVSNMKRECDNLIRTIESYKFS